MMYLDFTAGNKDYKLRLNTRAIVLLEKQLGCNPLAIFMGDGNETTVPTVTAMVTILHAALQQYQHSISLEDTFSIFDTWLEDGHSTTDFLTVILELYKVSGIIKTEDAEKNA